LMACDHDDADEMPDIAADACFRLFERAQADLSSRQLDVLSALELTPGLKTVVAGAGAGKTRTLSFIVQKALMQASVPGVSLLASTKTAKCEAFDRASKLYNEVGFTPDVVPSLSMRRVKTIHSVALAHAKERDVENGGAGVSVVGKAIVTDLIKYFLEEELDPSPKRHGSDDALEPSDADGAPTASEVGLKDVAANMSSDDAASLLYNVRSERLKNCLPVVDDSLGTTAYKVLKRLDAEMRCDSNSGQKLCDFDLLMYELSESGVPLVSKGEVLIIDEAQDLSFCQVNVVLNTLLADACVVVLGDDSQGIFQFSGALSNTIHELKRMSQLHGIDTTQFRLMQNHRSNDAVVLASEAFLPANDTALRKDIRGNETTNHPVEAARCHTPKVITTKLLELVQSKTCEPGDIVVLRHKSFGWGDELVKDLVSEAGKRGITLPISIPGQDVASTIEMKAVCILQMAIGLEHFVDSPDDGIHAVRVFMRGLRGSRGAPPNAIKAVSAVWERLRCDPSRLFSHHAEALLAEFKLIEQADDEHPKKRDVAALSKRQKTAVPGVSGESQKWFNFKETIRVAAASIKQVRERICNIKNNQLPLRPMVTSAGGQQLLSYANTGFNVSKDCLPSVQHPLGALAFIVVRDLVDHKFSDSDAHSLQRLVDSYDVLVPHVDVDFSIDDQIVAQTSRLVAELTDTETKGKLVFSTIHRFKGRERLCAFVVDIKKPFSNPNASKKAALAHTHDEGCNNRDGGGRCDCDGYRVGIERMKAAEISEKLRLYYVAASRAKERLFLAFSEDFDKLNAICPKCKLTAGQWAPCKTNPTGINSDAQNTM